MKAKVIFINPIGQETIVATVKSDVEAFQIAALFQAILPAQTTCRYVVEHKPKCSYLKRTTPDPFRHTVNNLIYLREHINQF